METVKYCKVGVRQFVMGLLIAAFSLIAWPATSSFAEEARPSVVIVGDSLTAGYQLPPGEGFPDKLQQAVTARGIGLDIIGAGVSGDTTSGGLARLDWSVPEGTDGVIIELGANDALRGLPPETTRANLEKMIARLKERGIAVMLVGMFAPPNMGADYEAKFNKIYPQLAAKHELPFYPFFLDGVAAEPALNLEDGIHPNEAGIAVIVERFLPAFEAFIEELMPAP